MAAISLLVRLAAGAPFLVMVGCAPMPSGPGRPIGVEQSSIDFAHPLYPGAEGQYTQRSGGHNSSVETANFRGANGAVFVVHQRSSGETYLSAPDLDRIVGEMGTTPEKNEIKAEGDLPDTFPVVRWVSYSATGDGDFPMSCLTVQRNGNSAGSYGGSYTTAVVMATECRSARADLTETDAAALSGSVRIK